jgi:hypothetical protein
VSVLGMVGRLAGGGRLASLAQDARRAIKIGKEGDEREGRRENGRGRGRGAVRVSNSELFEICRLPR